MKGDRWYWWVWGALVLYLIIGLLVGRVYGQEIVIGDSIAVGVKDAGKLTGDAKVGRAPLAVLEVAGRLADGLRDRVVILSTGLSNVPSELRETVLLLDVLQDAGARVIVLGVGEGVPGLSSINPWLEDEAHVHGMLYVWGWEGVHPSDYRAVLTEVRRAECVYWRLCGV